MLRGNRFAPASRQHGRAGARHVRGGRSEHDRRRRELGWHTSRWRSLVAPRRPPRPRPISTAGKTVQVLIGFSSGGGYDIYARTLGAPYRPSSSRANPGSSPQNMPGAGSLKAVNYLYNVAPQGRHRASRGFAPRRRVRAAARPHRGHAVRGPEVQLDRQHLERGERLRLHDGRRHHDLAGHADQAIRDRRLGRRRGQRRLPDRAAQHCSTCR